MSALLKASGNELFINFHNNRSFAYFLFGNNLFKYERTREPQLNRDDSFFVAYCTVVGQVYMQTSDVCHCLGSWEEIEERAGQYQPETGGKERGGQAVLRQGTFEMW